MSPKQLAGRTFKLGHVFYVVADTQPDEDKVRCYRADNNVVSLVRLPRMFVIERLAEQVALDMPA